MKGFSLGSFLLYSIVRTLFLPAVDDHGSPLLCVVPDNPLAEAKQCSGILWYPVVGPHQEVELANLTHWHLYLALACKLGWEGKREGEREGGREEGREEAESTAYTVQTT